MLCTHNWKSVYFTFAQTMEISTHHRNKYLFGQEKLVEGVEVVCEAISTVMSLRVEQVEADIRQSPLCHSSSENVD